MLGRFPLAALACLTGLASLAAQRAQASESDNGLDFKYMYYWDRNGVWNHTPTFSFFKKLSDYWKFQWNQELDAVSGASRRLGLNNIGILGDHAVKVDGVSGASKREIRHSEQAAFTHADQGRVATGSFYFSDESDYRSYSPALSGSWDLNQRNTTLGAGLSLFFDDMHPLGEFTGFGGSRTIASLSFSATQLLTPLCLVSVTINPLHSEGYLGHPYNPVIDSAGAMALENLPREKTGLALSGTVVQGYRLHDHLGSIHFQSRFYRDDWELASETADLQWYQYLTEGTYVRLRARGYHQGAAAFAKEAYTRQEVYRTADIRYFEFSSLLLGLKVASVFPESWSESRYAAWLPDRWDLSYDFGPRDTQGDGDGIRPFYHYQVFPSDQYYMQGTFMAGLSFDL